jgi:hypothetical protein
MQKKRVLLVFLVLALLVALPSSALACKRVYKAQMRTMPGVTGTHTGNFLMRYWQPGEILVDVTSQNLSGAPTDVFMDVAGESIVLCSNNPAVAMVSPCPALSGTGGFSLAGQITPALLMVSGVTNAELLAALDAGTVYVQVNTPANPAGEIRGQAVLTQVVCGQTVP